MRPTRAALFVAATALTPALPLSAPALATTAASTVTATPTTATATSDTPVNEMTDAELRAAISDILATNTGVAVVREATEVLNGTVDDMRAFLECGNRIPAGPVRGRQAVIQGCNDALDAGTPEAARAFRQTGYPLA